MPELPEVETTLNGIKPHIEHSKIKQTIIRHHGLRWPIPKNLHDILCGQTVNNIYRRAKYLIFSCDDGSLLLHLGMSGRVRILEQPTPADKHDHVDVEFSNGKILRLTDPRRFGALLWTNEDVFEHQLLKHLGPEPLDNEFNGDYLKSKATGRKVAVKNFIMDSKVVVGVGNIYATESLFLAGIHPEKPAGKVSAAKYAELAEIIKKVLHTAIKKGGTTLRDFAQSDGKPGYFKQKLKAYGRDGEPCVNCETELKLVRVGQRSSVFCPRCQKK